MEQTLGHDFSGVRLHNDAHADQLNRILGARAFTTGQDIYLRHGEADLSTRSGQELIAHELTHVAQQADGGGQAGGVPAVQFFLVPYKGPDYLEDTRTKIRAIRIGKTDIWVGDHDAQDYKIVKVNGVRDTAKSRSCSLK